MGNSTYSIRKSKRLFKFYLLSTLPDAQPIIVERMCYTINVCSQYLIPAQEMLSSSPSIQEVLWNFNRFKDEKLRLTLRENPHFYAELPISPRAYQYSIKIDPTEDFRHTNKFYVLTDKPELVYIMTNQVLQRFGNFWCLDGAIIFKGLGVLFCLLSVPDDSWPARHLWEAYGGEHCQGICHRRILWVLY